MNVIIWARVSSREQREGYSIDAQLRITRDRATREGWKVVREFAVAESAKRGAERLAFNEMFAWVRKNARREGIQAILSHKLDRVCRNMRDAVRLQELEDLCGVKLAFVDNQFGPGAAGALSFNVMAAVAQYYSDNLQGEVVKGMDEKVKQGWLPAAAPFGYRNVQGNRDQPIQPDPVEARAVARIFELYAKGDTTFKALADQLAAEGHIYQPAMTRFYRSILSRILNSRFYLGEIVWRGKTYPGKHQHLVSREVFDQCQVILAGKNRRYRQANHSYAGGLFRCAYCGQSLTGERIRRRLRGGAVREHLYYRCANNHRGSDHPPVRWRAEKLEQDILAELDKLKLPTKELRDWFRDALIKAFADVTDYHRRQSQAVEKRRAELKGQQDRLLNGYLNGIIDEAVFQTKSAELKCFENEVRESAEAAVVFDPAQAERVLKTFDFSQKAAEEWRGSNNSRRREIIEAVSLNRAVSDVSLCVTKRKPFDILAERPSFVNGRGDCTDFEPNRVSDEITPLLVTAFLDTPETPVLAAAQVWRESA